MAEPRSAAGLKWIYFYLNILFALVLGLFTSPILIGCTSAEHRGTFRGELNLLITFFSKGRNMGSIWITNRSLQKEHQIYGWRFPQQEQIHPNSFATEIYSKQYQKGL